MYELPVKGNPQATVNEFLGSLLSSGLAEAVIAMQETPTGKSAFPAMVSDPDKLNTNVFVPLLPVSTGTIVSRMTKVRGSLKPVAVVLRSCELRALTELVKLHQADLSNIILIGVDCPGTFPMNTFSSYPGKEDPTDSILFNGDAKKHIRSACLNCKDPVPVHTDLTIGIYGTDPKKSLLIETNSETGDKILEGSSLNEVKDIKKRVQAVTKARKERDESREMFLEEKADIKGIDKIIEFFDTCVNCHNCMKSCPICYCKECLFESAVFDLEANKYMAKAKGKGAFKAPPDSLLFHITRFNHMITSCVQCGLCEQACPSNIPLMDIITGIAENAQKEFDYIPGKDPEEPLPMVVYREEEFQDVGE
jgi:formate dehydrogenase subunit beta